jgi:hypothetical protein
VTLPHSAVAQAREQNSDRECDCCTDDIRAPQLPLAARRENCHGNEGGNAYRQEAPHGCETPSDKRRCQTGQGAKEQPANNAQHKRSHQRTRVDQIGDSESRV